MILSELIYLTILRGIYICSCVLIIDQITCHRHHCHCMCWNGQLCPFTWWKFSLLSFTDISIGTEHYKPIAKQWGCVLCGENGTSTFQNTQGVIHWHSYSTACRFCWSLLIRVWLSLSLYHMLCLLKPLDRCKTNMVNNFCCMCLYCPLEIKGKSWGIRLILCIKQRKHLQWLIRVFIF